MVELSFSVPSLSFDLGNTAMIPGPPGEDGVGIESVTFKETTSSGNVYTITLTDGSTYDFVAPKGPKGDKGDKGDPGGGGTGSDKTYVHSQLVSSRTWTITHNLEKNPAISVVDSSGNVVVGDILYVNGNSAIVTFNDAFSGKAYCN